MTLEDILVNRLVFAFARRQENAQESFFALGLQLLFYRIKVRHDFYEITSTFFCNSTYFIKFVKFASRWGWFISNRLWCFEAGEIFRENWIKFLKRMNCCWLFLSCIYIYQIAISVFFLSSFWCLVLDYRVKDGKF